MEQDLFEQFSRLEYWTHYPKMDTQVFNGTPLNTWLQWQLRHNLPAAAFESIPPAAAEIWHAWQCYHRGDYVRAHQLFCSCWERVEADAGQATQSAIAIDCALGLARLYTRSGHWHSARQFALFALYHSRISQRMFDLSRGHNVLGDLFCRAGQLQWAHVCLTTSTQLLPAGSMYKARHLNSLATVLLRQQQYERAESLLMTSVYLARDTADHDSFWHALARLQFLYNETAPTQKARQMFSALLPQKSTPIAQAFLALAEACSSLTLTSERTSRIADAIPMLTAFPIDNAWFRHLLGLPHQQELEYILQWQPAVIKTAPEPITDKVFVQFDLHNAHMQWLITDAGTPAKNTFSQQKNCFFI